MAQNRIQEAIKRNQATLHLASQKISSSSLASLFSEVLQNLPNLVDISLFNNEIEALDEVLFAFHSLASLNLSRNRISQIPHAIARLENLKKLSLAANKFTCIPESLSNLRKLEELDLSKNEILSPLPTFLDALSLKCLSLEFNQLTYIDPCLGECINLTDLKLSHNFISEIPEFIGDLPNLSLLGLENNLLRSLPDNLSNCKKLRFLNLAINRINSIAPVSGITTLVRLDVSFNDLRQIDPVSFFGLSSLKILILTKNLLTHLPITIGELSSLNRLYLENNQIVMLPDQIGKLKNLTHLFLEHNRLVTLPYSFSDLSHLNSLSLAGNNSLISPPPSVLFEGTGHGFAERIVAYFKEMKTRGGCKIARMKVVLMGDAMAGKTSLVRSLMADAPSRTEFAERTLALDISTLGVSEGGSNLIFDIFDFGGQEEYKVTHQLFLGGDRTIFLLLCPIDNDVDSRSIREWIRCILSRSKSPVVILVASKIDLCPSVSKARERVVQFYKAAREGVEYLERQLAGQVARLQRMKYTDEGTRAMKKTLDDHRSGVAPLVRLPASADDVLLISADDIGTIRRLKTSVATSIRDPRLFKFVDDLLPLSWLALMEEVEKLKFVYPSSMVTMDALWRLVNERCQFSDEHALREGIQFVSNLGLVMNFDLSQGLRDVVFLRPQWVANVIRMIVRHDLKTIGSFRLSMTTYTAGSVQFQQDVNDIRSRGLLWHRLVPALVAYRVEELKALFPRIEASRNMVRDEEVSVRLANEADLPVGHSRTSGRPVLTFGGVPLKESSTDPSLGKDNSKCIVS